MEKDKLSVIIPTLNEEENVQELVDRIYRALKNAGATFELIFIDDHSTDRTSFIIQQLSKQYPVRFYLKKGAKGKAASILEGVSCASYENVAIIDADLQYPPEALPLMFEKLKNGCDVVVANRIHQSARVGIIRKITNKGFIFFFSKLLHGLNLDSQAGMKIFRKKIISEISLNPSPWTFDLEFLLSARNNGYIIGSVDISFAERLKGKSKMVFWRAIYEIGSNALKLKFKKFNPCSISPPDKSSMIGAGLAYKRRRFITHTTLGHNISAIHTFIPWQRNFIIAAIAVFLFGLAYNPFLTGAAAVSVLSVIYFIDVFFNFYLVRKSLKNPPEIKSTVEELTALNNADLPVYSILCPLYKEARMLPVFIEAINKIDWPKDKLDILFLFEEDDKESIAAAQEIELPIYFRILIVPHSLPKTKPKACNYGLSLAKGEYIVIYDAEDIPDPLQLKKAYLGFQKVPPEVYCLQAKLNYFNPRQNLLTKLFTAEYSLWFDMILPGLQSINTVIPLGGTSNHFRRRDLVELKGWDPFNVTEDCDLGMRIFKKGYKTAIIDSVTLEEANSNLKNWLRQRSRWIKGYIQTYLVHMRHPIEFARHNGIHAFIFQLIVGGKTVFVFINPILWLATFSYFAFNSLVGSAIEELYPTVIFYMASISLVFGNFLAVYYYMIGCAKRRQWGLIKYVFLIPFYWALTSAASLIALYQLIVKPYFWEKTKHGLYRKKVLEKKAGSLGAADQPAPSLSPSASCLETVAAESSGALKNKLRGGALSAGERRDQVYNLRTKNFSLPPLLGEAGWVSAKANGAEIMEHGIFSLTPPKRRSSYKTLVFLKKRGNYKTLCVCAGRLNLLLRNFNILLIRGRSGDVARPTRASICAGRLNLLLRNFSISLQRRRTNVFSPSRLKKLYSAAISDKSFLIMAVLFSGFLNFVFNVFLGRVLDFENFGIVAFVNTFWYVIAIFASAFSSAVNHRTAYLSAAKSREASAKFLDSMIKKSLKIVIPLAIVWILAVPILSDFFNINDYVVFSFFAPTLVFALISSANNGFLSGNLFFIYLSIIVLSESILKLVLAAAFFHFGLERWVYTSIFFAVIFASCISMAIVKIKAPKKRKKEEKEEFIFPKHFFAASLATSVSAAFFLSIDIILAKHFLAPALVGEYALLSLVGKMIYFFASIPSIFMLTFVGRSLGLRKNPEKIFRAIYLATFILSFVGIAALGFFADKTIPLLFGEKALKILPFAGIYTVAIALFAITNAIVLYHLAKKDYRFAAASLFFSLAMAAGITVFHSSVEDIVKVIYFTSISGWLVIEALHYMEKKEIFLKRNFKDFIGAFGGELFAASAASSYAKRILIFNWRDTRHKFAGGAEIYAQKIAQYLADQGYCATIFCGNDGNSPRNEAIGKVEIIRRGGFYLVYVWAFLYYIFRFRKRCDIIIDCQNGIPFFTPLYTRKPIYCLMHHVHQDVFRKSLNKPLSMLARFLEKRLMPLVYKKTFFITVSDSSRYEMENLGLGKAGIWVVNPGIDSDSFTPDKKSDKPTILYLGRLKAYKSIDVLIKAFRIVVGANPEAVLIIAGSGEEDKKLKKLARRLNLSDNQIIFTGKVSEKEKIRLLKKAWVLANPSYMEGWGIVAIEAGACGTPVVASNVSGLRDSVKNGKTGYLVDYGNNNAFAEHILKIINDCKLRDKMSSNGRIWAEKFDWQKSGRKFISVIENGNKTKFLAKNLLYDGETN